MPVPTLITDLDTVAANNDPIGSESVGNNVDNYVRAHAAFIAQVYAGETGISDGIVKATSGTMAPAVAGTDYLAPAAIGVTVQAYDADIATVAGTAAEIATGTQTALRSWSPAVLNDALAAALTPQSVISYTGTGGVSSKGGSLTIASGSATVPFDATIPQASEMGAVVDVTITPSKVGAVIEVQAKIIAQPGTATRLCAGLFKDSGADALTVSMTTADVFGEEVTLLWRETAASLSAMTFKAKIGTAVATNIYIHSGGSSGTITMGGTFHSYIKATEVAYT